MMMRRARPLLGTYVEIEANGSAAQGLERAVNAAFEAVARVHRLMSFHEAGSDVSRLNRRAAFELVSVDRWTATVLRHARRLFEATDGLFDCAVGHELMQRGLLPSQDLDHVTSGRFSTVELLSDNRVRFSTKIAIDLGGIAKGFAVDRAIATLRGHGVREAAVNAGGDMRVMGETARPIYIRGPTDARCLVPAGLLRNGAVATSSSTATVAGGRARLAGASASVRSGATGVDGNAYSVVAPTCLVADALTKVLVQVGDIDADYFRRFGACAFITPPLRSTTGRPEPCV
jgi:thiamine biosynthesis lipoprotein